MKDDVTLPPSVAVVVPCRNEAAHIVALLDSLAGQTRVPDEIVIVDDGSTDASAAVVAAWAASHPALGVRIISGDGCGPAAAVNAGIRSSTSDFIIRLDGHSRPAEDYVERLLAAGHRGVIGGVWTIRPGAKTAVAKAIAAAVSHPIGSGGARYRHAQDGETGTSAVETVPFGAYPRQLWEQLGGLDEALVANEDFDFNYRARRAGYTVLLDPGIRVEYFARSTLSALARQYFRYGFWKFQMLRKDPRALHWRQVPPAVLLPWLMTSAVGVMLAPGTKTAAAALLYPTMLAVGAGIVGATRHVNPLAAVAALGVVHVAWSAGFCASVIQVALRQPSRT